MRRMWLWGVLVCCLIAVRPAAAAVDLLQRLVDKGILTEEERKELAKQDEVVESHKGRSFSWATTDGNYSAQLYGYGQVRFTMEDKDSGDDRGNFSVQRARLGLRGNALSKDLKYQLFLNVYSGNEKDVSLFDWFADYTPWKEFGIKGGQYKVPYAMQWNISAAGQQFVDRTTVDGNFRFDRDTGVSLHGTLFGMFSYDAGVFNGEGTNKNNPDDHFLWVGRLSAQPLGKYPNHESDNEISPKPVMLVSVAGAFDDDVSSHTRPNLNSRLNALGTSDVTSWNGFAGVKWMGASLQVEGHRREIEPKDPAQNDETALGYYVQGGYFVWKDKVEVAARYEYFDPDDDKGGDKEKQYGLGANYFFAAHKNKIQADFFRIEKDKGDVEDNQFRVQYQLSF